MKCKIKYICVILAVAIIVVFVFFGGKDMLRYSKASDLCKLIRQGELEKSLDIIEKMDDVNVFSAPLWSRPFFNMVETDIENPLVVACYTGNLEIVQSLLEHGANPNLYLDGNWSPIEAAFVSNNNSSDRLEIAKALVSYGADVNLYGSGHSALFFELERLIYKKFPNNEEHDLIMDSILFLLENNAEIVDERSNSIIHYLAFAGEIELLDKLAIENPELIDLANDRGKTPLMWAISGESVECVEYLLSAGANVQKKDIDGKTAYDYALEKGNQEIIDLLS
jgi:ankyrin repeat protein